MPHPHIIKTQIPQHILRLLDHPQLLRRHRLAVGNARTQTRHLRLVRRRQTHLRRQLANLRLRQPDLLQRRAHLKLRRRPRARTKIPHVTRILAISDHRKILRPRQRLQLREQLVLAEITTIRRIRQIPRVLKFPRVNHPHRKPKSPRDFQRLLQFPPRQTRRIRHRRQRPRPEHLVCDRRQKNRIHPTRIRHQARPKRAQPRPQVFQFHLRHARNVPPTPRDVEPPGRTTRANEAQSSKLKAQWNRQAPKQCDNPAFIPKFHFATNHHWSLAFGTSFEL